MGASEHLQLGKAHTNDSGRRGRRGRRGNWPASFPSLSSVWCLACAIYPASASCIFPAAGAHFGPQAGRQRRRISYPGRSQGWDRATRTWKGPAQLMTRSAPWIARMTLARSSTSAATVSTSEHPAWPRSAPAARAAAAGLREASVSATRGLWPPPPSARAAASAAQVLAPMRPAPPSTTTLAAPYARGAACASESAALPTGTVAAPPPPTLTPPQHRPLARRAGACRVTVPRPKNLILRVAPAAAIVRGVPREA